MSEKKTLGRFNSVLLNIRTRTLFSYLESPKDAALRIRTLGDIIGDLACLPDDDMQSVGLLCRHAVRSRGRQSIASHAKVSVLDDEAPQPATVKGKACGKPTKPTQKRATKSRIAKAR